MTENEWIIDLLIEFDEMGFIPTTTVPDPKRYAMRWRDRMCQALKGYRKFERGEWIPYSTTMMECSVCKKHTPRHRYNFCPHCGADMRGEDDA